MRAIRIPGFRVKDGKVIRDQRRLDVSTRLKQAGSKRIKVVRRGSV